MRDEIVTHLDEMKPLLESIAIDIWRHPQTGFAETYAVGRVVELLRQAGFEVTAPVAGMETAFIAEWGSGEPVIGILGEYDALPGFSQKVRARKEPEGEGAPGHACGHNLLGVAGVGAAIAAKSMMERHGIAGTVRFFGCPAEETLMGKVFMAREHVFDGLDAVLTWHPMYINTVWAASSAALNSFKLSFHGLSAHAGSAPHAGRSALDAVVLTDVGVNYLREHVINEARIHCVITHGGVAPNIVPAFAQIWYYVRAPRRSQVEQIYERVLNVARGAALMTETTLEVEMVAACHEYLPNQALQQALLRSMKEVGPPSFAEDDVNLARELKSTLPVGMAEAALACYGMAGEAVGDPLCTAILDQVGTLSTGEVQPVSTDVGDVSQIAPTAQLTACCMPLGVPLHTWQAVASTGSGIGLKTMMFVAKSLALTVLELMQNRPLVVEARREFESVSGGRPYVPPIPDDLKPPTSQ